MVRGTSRSSRWLLALMSLVLVATACSSTPSDTTAPAGDTTTTAGGADTTAPTVEGAEIVIAIGSEPSTLDPHTRDDGGERAINDSIYERLLDRDTDGQLIPMLAADLPTQVDEVTWEMTIRDGVQFHNGTELTAEVVAASFDRLIGLGAESEQSGFFETIDRVEATGDMTIRVVTKEPDPVLPSRLYWFKVIDAGAVGEGFDTNPVGTGPYKFVSWNRGSSVELEANPDYWGGEPSISKVTFRFIEEAGTRLAGLISGEFDLITNLSPEDAERAPKAVSVLGLEHPIFILNTFDGVTADVRVRQAMNYAIDKQALADALFGGRAQVDQCQILSPSIFGFNPDLEPYPYDPELAQQLIAEAGAEGAEVQVVGESGRWLKDRELIEAVANYWNAAGLNAQVEIYEFGEYLNRLFDRETRAAAIFVSSSNDLLDPTRQLGNYYSPEGIGSSNKDEEMLEWVTQAASETDVDVREELYHQATARACEDAYFAFLLNVEDTYGMSERLVWEPRVDSSLRVAEMAVSG